MINFLYKSSIGNTFNVISLVVNLVIRFRGFSSTPLFCISKLLLSAALSLASACGNYVYITCFGTFNFNYCQRRVKFYFKTLSIFDFHLDIIKDLRPIHIFSQPMCIYKFASPYFLELMIRL